MLDKLVPASLPYSIRGSIIRGIRTFLSTVMAGIFTAITNGTIISNLNFIPKDYAPVVLLLLTTIFMTADKYLREKGLEDDQNPPLPLPPEPPVVPDPVVPDQANEISPADPTPPDINDPANGPATDNATP